MHMIPDAAPPAQPTNLYRVTITTAVTEFDTVIFDATEAEARTVALRIVTEQGGDGGTIYQHHGGGESTYFDTVVVNDEPLVAEDVVAAIVAGDRTEQQLVDRFGVRLDRLLKGKGRLRTFLHGLVIDDLLYMEWPHGQGAHYKPTKKGRELVKARQGGAS